MVNPRIVVAVTAAGVETSTSKNTAQAVPVTKDKTMLTGGRGQNQKGTHAPFTMRTYTAIHIVGT